MKRVRSADLSVGAKHDTFSGVEGGGTLANAAAEMPPLRRAGRRRWWWFIAALGLVWLVMQWLPARGVVSAPNPFRASAPGQPLVLAHRGGAGLFPENTLEAFAGAAAMGCDGLEMDLRLTRDGVLVTCHDLTIDRTSDGRGRVREHTLEELRSLNFGARFAAPDGTRPYQDQPARLATFAEVLERHADLLLVVELKDRGEDGQAAAHELARLLARHGQPGRCLVASFDEATLAAFRSASGGRVPVSASTPRARNFVLCNLARLDWLAPAGDLALQLPTRRAGIALDRPRLVRAAHRRKVAVHYWTINDPAEMRRLAALGADGLITDRPDLLAEVLGGAAPEQ